MGGSGKIRDDSASRRDQSNSSSSGGWKQDCRDCDEPSGDIKVIKNMPSEDVLLTAGYVWRGGRGRGNSRGGFQGREDYSGGGKVDRPHKDHAGKPLTCHHCESIYHYLNKCPECDENVNLTETSEEVVLFTEDSRELSDITKEALNCAVLDTCCSSSVSGKAWLDFYLESLESKIRTQ